ICRDIAQRVNGLYGNVFTIPEGYYSKVGGRVQSLQDPSRKMSKSDAEDSFISVLDTPDVIRRKYRRAVTDSLASIRFDPENQPGVSNLLSIICALTGEDMEKLVASFEGKGYGELKAAVTDVTIETLAPIQEEFARVMKDKKYMEEVYRDGAQRAGCIAERTLQKFMKKIGYTAK
ncbi:MAG: tryptophan--tRNA ligase, partial [Candidatus Ventricola sp.]